MKFKIRSACFWVLLLGTSLAAMAQERVLVRGYMLDEDTYDAVPLANILVRNNNTRFVSNRNGLFRISIAPDDTVYITGIGYASRLLTGRELIPANTDDTIRVFLKTTVYKLKDVNVVYSNRKRDSIARLAAEYLKNDPLLNNYDRVLDRPRGSAMSPLTAMYEAWAKEAQDMQKFEEFLQYAEAQKEVDRRYNKAVIKKVTGLDDAYLDDFILFCKIDRNVILNAEEYDLYVAIRKCNDEFQAQQLRKRTKLR